MLILDKTRINILVDVNFLIPTFQVVLIHINKVGNRINKVGHETTKWVNESTKWVNESTSWTAPNQPRGSRQLYVTLILIRYRSDHCNWPCAITKTPSEKKVNLILVHKCKMEV